MKMLPYSTLGGQRGARMSWPEKGMHLKGLKKGCVRQSELQEPILASEKHAEDAGCLLLSKISSALSGVI